MMKKTRLLAAGAVAVLAMTLPIGSAQAADGKGTASSQSASAAAAEDGMLHAWVDSYRGGAECTWAGSSRNWDGNDEAIDCGGMRNRASSLENRGYEGIDAVNLYWDIDQEGAWACLGRGDMWLDLSLGREIFSFKDFFNSGGYGQSLENNISSHNWVDHC
ncbi:hypothetical protein ACFVGN_36945 [Streptomyces sp. NPDC057757]|uniref:hypothetical protein n=1 Tax=Streptomyces sp. NPDC057757 TaxID=3346241 RepID=UPI0036A71201